MIQIFPSKIKAKIKESFQNGYWTYSMAFLIMILIPVHVEVLPPFMVAWLIFRFIEKIYNNENFFKLGYPSSYLAILFGLFYLILILSLTYSENIQGGILLLFRRLSLLVFPLIFFSPGDIIHGKLKTLLKTFSLATTAYLLACFLYAFERAVSFSNGNLIFNPNPVPNPWDNFFHGPEFSFSQHPSYLAMYVVLSVFISLELGYKKANRSAIRILWLAIAFFLFVSLFFLASRAGILVILVLLPVYLLSGIRRPEIKYSLLSLFIILLFAIAFQFKNGQIENQFIDLTGSSIPAAVKSDERVSIWKSAIGVIKANLAFGVGIGDACEELKHEFKDMGFVKGYYDNLNAHNQYLEVLLVSGLPGFSTFIAILATMSFIALKNRNKLYGLFIVMMLIFFMFESNLNRLAGVSFFSLFAFLLIPTGTRQNKDQRLATNQNN
jgi:O-antigen ligase